jgi:hypothetical protein
MYFRNIREFIRNRSTEEVVEIIPYLDSKEFVSLLLSEFIGRLRRSDLADYRTLINALWPFLTEGDKLRIFESSATKNDGRTELVLSMLDCSLNEKTLNNMINIAAQHGNRTAFEYACERSSKVGGILVGLKKAPDYHDGEARLLVKQAIAVGSAKWFFQLVQSGMDLDPMIEENGEICLPMLSDCDPEGLPARLASHGFHITDQMIARATTEAGKQALRKLQHKDSSTQ